MRLTEAITRRFLEDVYLYFYNAEFRENLLTLMTAALETNPKIVIAHSLGSVIAYDALIRRHTHLPMLITVGSPLGLENVKAELRRLLGVGKLPVPAFGNWLNVADLLDPVACDKTLSDDYDPNIVDVRLRLPGLDPHSAACYLGTGSVRQAVADLLLKGERSHV